MLAVSSSLSPLPELRSPRLVSGSSRRLGDMLS